MLVLGLGLCAALPTAGSAAATDFTWSGAAPVGESNWSDGKNWQGGTAPSGTVETLTFPTPPSAACEELSVLDTCGNTNNNISGLSVNSLAFPDPHGALPSYTLAGEPLTLGSGGLTAEVAVGDFQGQATLSLPITLGAPQTWSLEQWRFVLDGNVTGPEAALGANLGYRGELAVNSNVEAGPITITGTGGHLPLEIQNGGLNATDGHSVSLVNTELYVPPLYNARTADAGVGALTSTASDLILDEPLAVSGGVKLDSSSKVQLALSQTGPAGELNAQGPVDLANAHLGLFNNGGGCGTLAPGETKTLVIATGQISGTFAGVLNGGLVELPGGDCRASAIVRIAYTAHSVTATAVATEPVGGALTLLELLAGGQNPSEFCPACFMGKLISFFQPVDAPTGNFWHTFDDLSVPGRGIRLNLTRTYNSMSAGTAGPFGFGWSFPYDMALSFPDATHVVVNQENGSQVTFTEQSGGAYTAPPRVTATLVHNGGGSWTFVRRHRDTFSFDSTGRLMQEKDLNGYVTALAYNGSGQVATATDSAGRKLTFAYTGSHITSVTDPVGRVVTYAYDGTGNLIDVTDVNGGNTHFTYDSAHRMLTMRFPNQSPGVPGATGAVVSNVYDGQGRVTEQTDQLGRTTKFAYAGEPLTETGGSTTITDSKGNVIVQNYRFGELESETKGYGTPQAATWIFGYDPATLGMTSVTDPNGHTTTSIFDSEGNTLTSTDALGRTATNTYDSLNDRLTTTDPLGVTTTTTYDGHGNLLSSSRPLSGTSDVQGTTYTYGDASHPGDVTAMTDPEGNAWKYTYDAYGDRTSSTDPLGNTATFTYNTIGWLLSTTSPRGNAAGANAASFTTTYAHNSFGQTTETVDPLGHKTTSQYDSDHKLIASTDANGNTTTNTYDAADEQTAVHRADGTTLQTTYWPDGTVKEQIDGAGHPTRYEYDPLGRVSAVTDPLGRTTQYGYDLAGNRITVTDPVGRVTATTYDAANEPTSITYSDGKTPNVAGITYDADGERTAETDGSGAWSWRWDSLHRLTNVTEGNSGTVKYQYDLRNSPTMITYPNGHSVTRGYDAAGRWTSVTDWLGNTTNFAYDPDGNMATETLPAGTGITDTSTYANDDTLSAINDKRGASTLFAANYTRDANRQLTGDSSQPTTEGGYGYTALNQLCYAGTGTGSCTSPLSGATQYQYDSADNLVRMGATTQTFDAANELTSASAPAGSGEQASGGGISGGGVNGGGNVAKKEMSGIIEQRIIPSVTSGKVAFTRTSGHGRPVVSQALSTNSAGDLVLAFVSAKGPRLGRQGVTVIKGGGLKWSLVTTASFHGGYVAIWKAQARKRLTRVRVSVSLRKRGYAAALAVVGFDSKAAVVRSAKGSSSKGTPRVAVAVPPDAVVWAVGQDTAQHPKPKPLPGQVLVGKPAVQSGGTSWIQSDNAEATERLLVGDSAPKSSSWALGAVTIREQAVTVPGKPPITQIIPAPVPGGSGLPPTTANGTLTYTYDAEGDRNSAIASISASQTYSYNQVLELTGIGGEVSYTYSGDGLRMSKTVGATTTPFTWDVSGGLPSVLEDGTNAYVYGPGGLPLEQVSGNTALWFHHDQLGSTRLLTNEGGQTVAAYAYTAYGSLSNSSGTVSTPLLYTGQYRDSESGLYYLRARYYDPATAQFLSKDPAAAITMAPYSYVTNNPPNRRDPSGRCVPGPALVVCLLVGAAIVETVVSSFENQDSCDPDTGSCDIPSAPIPLNGYPRSPGSGSSAAYDYHKGTASCDSSDNCAYSPPPNVARRTSCDPIYVAHAMAPNGMVYSPLYGLQTYIASNNGVGYGGWVPDPAQSPGNQNFVWTPDPNGSRTQRPAWAGS